MSRVPRSPFFFLLSFSKLFNSYFFLLTFLGVSHLLSALSLSTITPSQRQPNARIGYNFLCSEMKRAILVRHTTPATLKDTHISRVQFTVILSITILLLLL